MEGIATYMLINQLPNQISAKQLEEVVRLLIDSILEVVSSQADAQSGELRKPLRQRYDLANRPEEIQSILTDVRACGLLVPDLSRSGSFKFGHKSFMEFLAGKVFAQWSLRKELSPIEENIVCSLVNSLELEILHVVQLHEALAFAVEWVAEKAKDHDEAAKLIFALTFRAYSLVKRLWLWTLRHCLPIMSHIKTVDIGNVSAREITVCFFFVFTLLSIWVLPSPNFFNLNLREFNTFYNPFVVGLICMVIFIRTSNICIREKSHVAFSHLGVMFLPFFFFQSIELLWVVMLMLITMLVSVILVLLRGYHKHEQVLAWMNFRIWHAICTAAHLERTAMTTVIGEKSLCLLEEVANKEPHPWTIAESLEWLDYRNRD